MKPITSGKPQYDPAFFSEGYYGKGERGGFPHYEYGSDEQNFQLALKLEVCNHVPHDSALFVGCARGFEVAHWIANKTHEVRGVDVSEWAIKNQIKEACEQCERYDGSKLDFPDRCFDLVASFDVLTLVPDHMLATLADEMVRVARNGIVFRVYVKNWQNLNNEIDGEDGATFKLRHFWEYDKVFSQSGKFKLDWMKMHGQYECTAVYQRAL
jgi:SAM-dependent methyltransferase